MLGKEEYDRNSHSEPLRVETDFDATTGKRIANFPEISVNPSHSTLAHDNSGSSNSIHSEDGSPNYAHIPPKAVLSKGYDRVSVIFPASIPTSEKIRDRYPQQVYEVVLHRSEAYLMKKQLLVDQLELVNSVDVVENCAYNVVHYAAGWKHSLLAVDTLDTSPLNWKESFGPDYE